MLYLHSVFNIHSNCINFRRVVFPLVLFFTVTTFSQAGEMVGSDGGGSASPLEVLPSGVLSHILKGLAPKDVAHLREVSRALRGKIDAFNLQQLAFVETGRDIEERGFSSYQQYVWTRGFRSIYPFTRVKVGFTLGSDCIEFLSDSVARSQVLHLTLDEACTDSESLKLLGSWTQLKSLSIRPLSQQETSDRALIDAISKLTALESVFFYQTSNRFDKNYVQGSLKNLPHLKSLGLSGGVLNTLKDADLSDGHVQLMPDVQLETLTLESLPLRQFDHLLEVHRSTLREFRFAGEVRSLEELLCLTHLIQGFPKLSSLDLQFYHSNFEGSEGLAEQGLADLVRSLPRLQKLAITGRFDFDLLAKGLQKAVAEKESLESLKLSGWQPSQGRQAAVGRLPQVKLSQFLKICESHRVKRLELSGLQIKMDLNVLDSLLFLRDLHSIHLDGSVFDTRQDLLTFFSLVSPIPLRHLSLSGLGLLQSAGEGQGDGLVVALAKMFPGLKRLEWKQVTNAFDWDWTKFAVSADRLGLVFPNLESLTVEGQTELFSKRGREVTLFSHLSQVAPQLKSLSLTGILVETEDANELTAHPQLVFLSLLTPESEKLKKPRILFYHIKIQSIPPTFGRIFTHV